MLGLENRESRRTSTLVEALDQHEITIGEFTDGIRSVSSEALQVTAFILSELAAANPERSSRLWQARHLCSGMAAASRVLS
jgi:hypothetical protein